MNRNEEVELFHAKHPKVTTVLYSIENNLSKEETKLISEFNTIMLFENKILSPCLFLFAKDSLSVCVASHHKNILKFVKRNISFCLEDFNIKFKFVGASTNV